MKLKSIVVVAVLFVAGIQSNLVLGQGRDGSRPDHGDLERRIKYLEEALQDVGNRLEQLERGQKDDPDGSGSSKNCEYPQRDSLGRVWGGSTIRIARDICWTFTNKDRTPVLTERVGRQNFERQITGSLKHGTKLVAVPEIAKKRVILFAVGYEGKIYYRTLAMNGEARDDWNDLGGDITDIESAYATQDDVFVLVKARREKDALWIRSLTTDWRPY